jgi:hypothetical protein
VSGDVFRPTEKAFRSSQAKNTLWFARLISSAIRKAVNLPVVTVNWGQDFDTPGFYDLVGVNADLSGWAAIYDGENIPIEAIAEINRVYRNSIVVGFELPTILKRAFSYLDIVWIDFAIHPIRFLPDLIFVFQTNSADVFYAALDNHIDYGVFERWAAILSATAVRLHQPAIGGATALLVGQTRYDRAVIRGGRFEDFRHYAVPLTELTSAIQVAFKPHPYEAGDFGSRRIGVPYDRIRQTSSNIYRLMGAEQLTDVVVLSSSVGYEAPFFGKQVTWLRAPRMRIANVAELAAPSDSLSLGSCIVNADFWRRTLRPLTPVSASDGVVMDLPPNTLRVSLQNFWGYNEVTSDIIVDAAHKSGRGTR